MQELELTRQQARRVAKQVQILRDDLDESYKHLMDLYLRRSGGTR
jgi:hypothetical protein